MPSKGMTLPRLRSVAAARANHLEHGWVTNLGRKFVGGSAFSLPCVVLTHIDMLGGPMTGHLPRSGAKDHRCEARAARGNPPRPNLSREGTARTKAVVLAVSSWVGLGRPGHWIATGMVVTVWPGFGGRTKRDTDFVAKKTPAPPHNEGGAGAGFRARPEGAKSERRLAI